MIVLQSADLSAHILPRGATLAGLWLNGNPRSLVLGFADPFSFEASAFYAGAIVGPVANRIARGRVDIDGTRFQMPLNEGANCLHSGDEGLDGLDWDIREQTPEAVTLAVDLADYAIGLPGARRICVTYALEPASTLSLTITASSDCDTVMNIAHHPYWTLDGAPDVSGHRLQVQAAHYLPVDYETLPTGEILSVEGSDYDFRTARAIPVNRPLDANLCLSAQRSESPCDVATLTGSTGINLHIATTEPGLQIYNGSGLPTDGPPALPGQIIAPYSGIALEPQGWPDAPNHVNFPSIMLAAGAQYHQQTRYRITPAQADRPKIATPTP